MIDFLICLLIIILIITVLREFLLRKRLRRELNETAAKLKKILDDGSEENIMVFTSCTEMSELLSQINRLLEDKLSTKAEARRFKNSYKTMLANISHDIKTPLTVLLGYIEIMRIKGSLKEDMLLTAENKAKEVTELTDKFFTLAKIESGDLGLELRDTNICEICRNCVLGFYEVLTSSGFKTEVGIPDSPVIAEADAGAVERILSNLISNAIRHGGDGKYLGVFLRVDKGCVYIDIADKGRGIEKSGIKNIFDRRFTSDSSFSGGSGLGLAIAKNLALQQGGDIFVKSLPGEKTVFTFKLACIERNL